MSLTVSDFDFDLPPTLIAQHPAISRTSSRLLQVGGAVLRDRVFPDLTELLGAGDLLVFNDTRVLRARFHGQKASGGKVEVMLERIIDQHHALAQIRASKSPRSGGRLLLADSFEVEVTGRAGEFFVLELLDTRLDFWQLTDAYGQMPLPPYIRHVADVTDEQRYQTVYAREPGAVAAPTAGLHFDQPLLTALAEKGVNMAFLTLHVGAGTFQPVRVENIAEHRMHRELFNVPEVTVKAIEATRQRGGRIVAVGTTSLRALESAASHGELIAGHGETDIFITPGYVFRVVDQLLTNFHLPRSTLLMLVSAFAGVGPIRAAYAHAIREQYRFFSYGDAMLLERAGQDL